MAKKGGLSSHYILQEGGCHSLDQIIIVFVLIIKKKKTLKSIH